MDIIRFDLMHGSVSIGSTLIETGENGILVSSIEKRSARQIRTDQECERYRLLEKVSVCGHSAECVIDIEEGRTVCIAFLFDLIEFFNTSILESKVIRACEHSWKLKFISTHPCTAFLENCAWGKAIFSYDAKQGDLSLDIRLERRSVS